MLKLVFVRFSFLVFVAASFIFCNVDLSCLSGCVTGWQSELQRFLVAWEEGPPSMAFCTSICAAMGRQAAAIEAG